MNQQNNLSKHSVTFPILSEPVVQRVSALRMIHDRFSEKRKVIVVQAPDGAGKTTLLAQFAEYYGDRSFSFFIKPDKYIATSKRLYQELCGQMHLALKREVREFFGDYNELRQQFADLYTELARKAKSQGHSVSTKFFFVVDGLEWVGEDSDGSTLLKDLPIPSMPYVYLLASSRSNQSFPFDFDSEPCPSFSDLEISRYFELAGIPLSRDAVEQIYRACSGMPGYLDQLRREMLDRPSELNEIIKHLPREFKELLERNWREMAIQDEKVLHALSILSFSQSTHSWLSLSQITGIDELHLHSILNSVPWVVVRDEPAFITDAHRQFVCDKLSARREMTEVALIAYYSANPYSPESIQQLPVLLKETRDLEKLRILVTPDYLSRTLQQHHDLFLLKRSTLLASQAAIQEQNWNSLFRFALLNSIVTTISNEVVLESEVEAYLALEDYDQSYKLASKAILPQDRLLLLAGIGNKLVEMGKPVPSAMLAELERLVTGIDETNIPMGRLAGVAAELFYVLPDTAVDLINRVIGPDGQDKSVDILLAILTTDIEKEDPGFAETLRTRLRDKKLQDFTRANSSIVASLNPESIIARTDSVEDTSAKLYQLRSWCNSNRGNPGALPVIRLALRLMTAAESNASIRHLRQFAEPLLVCESDEVLEVIEQFDLLKDTALANPAEEKIRLELILAAVEARIAGEDRASTRFLRVFYELYEGISESDSRCYGLARMLVSLPEISPTDDRLRAELESHLRIEFEKLLSLSAQHYSLTRRILGPLTNYDVKMASEFAEKLNVEERRNNARARVATVYSDRDLGEIDFAFLAQIVKRISDPSRRHRSLVSVLENLAKWSDRQGIPRHQQESLRTFIAEAESIDDPIGRSFAYAHAVRLYAKENPRAKEACFTRLFESWNLVDAVWERVQLGFTLDSVTFFL